MSSPVKGTEDIIRALENLPARMQDGAIRAGLTAAAKVIREEARLRAPRQSGRLAKAVVSGSPRKNQDNTFSISVYVDKRKPHGFLGQFFEYGVRPHVLNGGDESLSPRKLTQQVRAAGGVLKIGKDFVSGVVTHPGLSARPFMRPALDTMADEAIAAFTVRIRAYIEGVEAKTGYNAFADAA